MNLFCNQNSIPIIPPFVNQEVKQEESTSVKLPSSDLYLNKSLTANHSIFDHFPKTEFSKANLNYLKETDLLFSYLALLARPVQISKLMASNDVRLVKKHRNQDINQSTLPKVEFECKLEPELKLEAVVVKKEEEQELIKPKKPVITEKKLRKSKDDYSPKKKAQNRIKNFPGLVVQRVKSTIKMYVSTKQQRGEVTNPRMSYVAKVVDSMEAGQKNQFISFIDKYQKNWKTWNTIQTFLNMDPKLGRILLSVVMEFFGEEGNEDFKDWITSGKMGEKSKDTVMSMKTHIANKFQLIVLEGESQDQIPYPQKLVKKSET